MRLDGLAPVVIFSLTSAGAFLVGARRRSLRARELPRALTDVLHSLGLAVLFLLSNLAVGTAAILCLRALTGDFISIYVVGDITLPILSLVQALIFRHWRARSE